MLSRGGGSGRLCESLNIHLKGGRVNGVLRFPARAEPEPSGNMSRTVAIGLSAKLPPSSAVAR